MLAEFARDRDRPGDEVGGRDDLVDPSACRRGGDVDAPPTPRQFVRLLMRPGIEEARLALERFRESPRSPIYTDVMLAGSMLYQMLEDGRHDDAARYYAVLKEMPLDVLRWFAELSEDEDEREQALQFLNVAHHLDPDDADIAARLRSMRVS